MHAETAVFSAELCMGAHKKYTRTHFKALRIRKEGKYNSNTYLTRWWTGRITNKYVINRNNQPFLNKISFGRPEIEISMNIVSSRPLNRARICMLHLDTRRCGPLRHSCYIL